MSQSDERRDNESRMPDTQWPRDLSEWADAAGDAVGAISTGARDTAGALSEGARGAADAAGKTAMAAVLAGTIAVGANAVTLDDINLPDPVPIVQTVDQPVAPLPDDHVDDQDKEKSLGWKKALKFLLYILVAMLTVASIAFGALQGCTSCAGSAAVPLLHSTSSEQAAQ